MNFHITCMEEARNAYKVLIGKCEAKRPLGKCRCELRIILN
jgi:hypothetical protein